MIEVKEIAHKYEEAREEYKEACASYEEATHRFIRVADQNCTESSGYMTLLKAFGAAWQRRRVAERCLVAWRSQKESEQ